MHLDDEILERILHRELEGGGLPAAREHLRACSACSARLEETRHREARIFGLLERLDEPAPARPAISVPPRGPSWLRIAAAVALVVVAGGAIAFPGSPIRQWISTFGSDEAGSARGPSTRPTPEPSGAGSGITVQATAPFRIVFQTPQEAGDVRVTLGAGSDVEVRVSGDPVVFESAPDRLTIANRGSRSSYEIRLPAAGPPIEIRVEGRTVLELPGRRTTTDGAAIPEDEWRIDLAP